MIVNCTISFKRNVTENIDSFFLSTNFDISIFPSRLPLYCLDSYNLTSYYWPIITAQVVLLLHLDKNKTKFFLKNERVKKRETCSVNLKSTNKARSTSNSRQLIASLYSVLGIKIDEKILVQS